MSESNWGNSWGNTTSPEPTSPVPSPSEYQAACKIIKRYRAVIATSRPTNKAEQIANYLGLRDKTKIAAIVEILKDEV